MNNAGYLIAAYLVLWIGTFVYLFSIDRRQKKVQDELHRLTHDGD